MVGEFFMMTLQQIDMSILLWIQEHLRADALTPFWKVITFLGNGGWFWLVLAAGLLVCAAIKTALTYIKEMNLVQRMSIFTRKTNKADYR